MATKICACMGADGQIYHVAAQEKSDFVPYHNAVFFAPKLLRCCRISRKTVKKAARLGGFKEFYFLYYNIA
jgi:hypothetical protein